ncbi:MAG: hypothetical protein WKF77_02750 [Planctomycetaceae bacterium]
MSADVQHASGNGCRTYRRRARALTRAIEGAEDDARAAVAELKALHVTDRDVVMGIATSGRHTCLAREYARSIGHYDWICM